MKTDDTQVVETIDLSPNWEGAVRIYCDVLENPDSGFEAKHSAREDILNLARAMDAARCASNKHPCNRRRKSSDNTCMHYPDSE